MGRRVAGAVADRDGRVHVGEEEIVWHDGCLGILGDGTLFWASSHPPILSMKVDCWLSCVWFHGVEGRLEIVVCCVCVLAP